MLVTYILPSLCVTLSMLPPTLRAPVCGNVIYDNLNQEFRLFIVALLLCSTLTYSKFFFVWGINYKHLSLFYNSKYRGLKQKYIRVLTAAEPDLHTLKASGDDIFEDFPTGQLDQLRTFCQHHYTVALNVFLHISCSLS